MGLKDQSLKFVLLLTLLYIQQGSLLHATEHQFHEYDAYCDIFMAGERLADANLQNVFIPPDNTAIVILSVTFLQIIGDTDKPVAQARSPPSVFS